MSREKKPRKKAYIRAFENRPFGHMVQFTSIARPGVLE